MPENWDINVIIPIYKKDTKEDLTTLDVSGFNSV